MSQLRVFATAVFLFIPVAIFIAMVAALKLGQQVALNLRIHEKETDGAGPLEGALFALFGLLVAFSFSGAQDRLDVRRAMIVDEATAIGTAYLRLDVLPAADRPALKEKFRRYVDARINYYRKLLDNDVAGAEQAVAVELQNQIWTETVASTTRAPDERAATVVLPALNTMFDITTKREAAMRTHIPIAIFALLGLLSVACAFLAGIDMARAEKIRHVYVMAFAGTMALAAFVILNLEFPRLGFVRFEPLDALLIEARAQMR